MERVLTGSQSRELVLITGASSDIGQHLARSLLLASVETHVLAHSFQGGQRIESLASEFPGRVTALQADLTSREDAASLARTILAEHGVPTAFVHLPALRLKLERFTKFDWSFFERDLNIQVGSAVAMLQVLMPKMAKLARGRVIFMLTSTVHGVPPKFSSSYTIAKYAELGLMRALAAEYASSPVRVNAVSPSMVETQFLSEMNELAVQGAASSNPLGRNATPSDVTGAIQFLLSPAADYISGTVLPIAAGTVA